MKVIFAGTPDFAVPSLKALLASHHEVLAVYTQPDRKAGRGQQLTPSPVKQVALQEGLSIYQPHSLREVSEQERLAAFHADVIVVAAYGLILPPSVLALPRYGCLNVHASLLPRWRGASPIQAAILTGDALTGVTIMQMDVGLDTGDILLKREVSTYADETSNSLSLRLSEMGGVALLEVLEAVEVGRAEAIAQDDQEATYAPKLNKTDARIVWSLSAERLARQVRAFNPWPVSFFLWKQEAIRIWMAKALPPLVSKASPGQVVGVSCEGVRVATGAGDLLLMVLQRPGKKRQSVAETVATRTKDFFRVGDQLEV